MKKNILKISFALAVVVVAGYTTYSSQTKTQLSEVSLNNVEALANGEDGSHKYEIRDETTMEVLDDETHTYKKVTVIECDGTGDLEC